MQRIGSLSKYNYFSSHLYRFPGQPILGLLFILVVVFLGELLSHPFAVSHRGRGTTRGSHLGIESGLGIVLILEHLLRPFRRLLPNDRVGDGDGGGYLHDVLTGADEGEHPAIFLAVVDEFLDGGTCPFLRGIFIAVGDDGHKYGGVLDVLDVGLELLHGFPDGVEKGSAAARLVLLLGELVGVLDGRLVIDHVNTAVAESGQRNEMILGVQVLQLGGADSAKGLIVAVDGFLADGLHGAGLVEDDEVENLSLGGDSRSLHGSVCFEFWHKVTSLLSQNVVQHTKNKEKAPVGMVEARKCIIPNSNLLYFIQ